MSSIIVLTPKMCKLCRTSRGYSSLKVARDFQRLVVIPRKPMNQTQSMFNVEKRKGALSPDQSYYRAKDRFWKYNKDIIPRPLPYNPNTRIEKPEIGTSTMSEKEFYLKVFPERVKKAPSSGHINLNQKSKIKLPKVKKRNEPVKLKINHGLVPGIKKYKLNKPLTQRCGDEDSPKDKKDLISIIMKLYKDKKPFKTLPFSEPSLIEESEDEKKPPPIRSQKILKSLYKYGSCKSATHRINERINQVKEEQKGKNQATIAKRKSLKIPPPLSTALHTQQWQKEMISFLNESNYTEDLNKKFMVYQKAFKNITEEDQETQEVLDQLFHGLIKISKAITKI
ncbi:unnamed protein product [Moneuplotes crassus]|uniref:Uncharacterized protein n=1 Tax=Euplotes crassus TaxID=5936 RepID=A0AAD1XEX9_EUPCR|nr:unnamed protein product [Moneuplotes crassus]